MKKRIGNDIPIVWTLTDTEGNPYDLTGSDFKVYLKMEGTCCVSVEMAYTLNVNAISFTFYGKDQPGVGKYNLLLVENAGSPDMVAYDVQNVIELVPHSWDEDEGDIDIESEIATSGEVNVIEVIKVNGVEQPVVDKEVDLTVPTALAGLSEDATHRIVTDAEKSAWNAKYDKPSGGIPASDLASSVQASLGKADTALQSYTETDPTVPAWAKASSKPSYDYSEIGGTPDLSSFITKSVNDLTNYYLKSETYTQAEVQGLIGAIQQFHYEIYASTSAVTSPAANVLYLIGPTGSGDDKYEEYVYSSGWVKIGDTSIDLSGYVTTSALNTALGSYTTTSDLTTLLAGKQDTISDLATIRSGAAAGATALQSESDPVFGASAAAGITSTDIGEWDAKYDKPSGGIPKSDLASGVQTSLGKADTALQSFTETDPVFGASAAAGITSADISTWNNKSDFSGAYADLTGKPTIPSKTSDLTNDSGYITINDIPEGSAASTTVPKMDGTAAVGSELAFARGDHVHPSDTSKQDVIDSSHKLPYSLLSGTPTIPDELADLSDDATHRLVTDTEKSTWDNKSDFSGSYDDLTDKPTIPTVPTNVSAFTNDAGYLTSYTETDPTVPAWAKASSKPTYNYSEIQETPTIPTVESLTTAEIDTIWNNA